MTHSTPLSTTTPVDPSSPYFNCGSFSRKITTSSPAAQIWFNRGLFWCYSFNHDEAVRCFLQSTLHDINCSMAWWGIAYALGANYNKPWELFNNLEEDLVRISYALDMAKKAIHKDHLENALIKSIDSRMPGDISNREFNFWEKRYMYSMREIYNDHHNDLDVVAFYAEAMMNQTPWQLWDLQTGEPAPGSHAIEIERILETALALPGGDSHPGLLHFYIHTEELSQHPEKAVVPGDKLIRVAGDAGHLLHMPSHLDILIGDYRRSINANALAIDADIKYCEKEGYTGFFMIYLFHDFDSLIYATMFNGQFEVAMKYVKWEQSIFTDSLIDTHGDYLEASAANKIHVLVRFGRWEDLIALELPKDQKRYSITTTMIHYGKGVAYAATGLVEEALEQRRLFLEAKNNVPAARMFFPNKASDVLDIAAAMLDGEIEYRRKNYEVAFAHLAKSIELYDGLIYAEPWGWMQPTRHPYAALLLEQGHVEKALAIYAADLGLDGILPRSFQHPNNVWALHGYYECLIKLGRHEEAKQIKPQLTLALAIADVKIESSCFCRLETVIIENIEQKLGKSCCK